YKLSQDRLRSYLNEEVALRYDSSPTAPLPVAGTTGFQAGVAGTTLDVDRAILLIEDALKSPTARTVNLTFNSVTPPRPSMQNLQILLEQTIDASGFDGITELYLLDLQTSQELNFAYQNGTQLQPGIAFTAASTMKIPIMMSVFRRTKEPIPTEIDDMIKLMIERSENDPADRLMERVMDQNLGPLQVTDDLKQLGLENTFLAGYFYVGAPLLQRIQTPANQRTDVDTNPDEYNQTTPLEMGLLLDDLYVCSQSGGGTFAAAFPGEISQAECNTMINYLASNRIGVLIQSGLPDGTRVANKHGWITELDGLLHTIGDAGIIYSPGGNYIMAIYMYHPTQLVFDPANQLVADITRAIYNYFNLSASSS
ncbi:MAG: hypothetical protein GYA17_00820, partial [Chloroflexi bacterium]|nr:hypothetical protein [Chloroflexota bacterium]